MKRWVARAPAKLAEVLAQMQADAAAIGDGRVFVGRTRARDVELAIAIGDEILVHDRALATPLPEPFVLHDDGGLLAVDKPAGISTIPDERGAAGSLIALAAEATGRSIDALHPTSRLDREVSGVVIFAVDAAARDALAAARSEGAYERRYVAIAAGDLPDRARWTWSIGRARDPKLRCAVEPGSKDALVAATRVAVVERARVGRATFCLLAVAPETGRTHQIRVHAAAAGAPLVGDRAYGGPTRVTASTGKVTSASRIALHCARVAISRPGCMISVASPVSREVVELAQALGLGRIEEAQGWQV